MNQTTKARTTRQNARRQEVETAHVVLDERSHAVVHETDPRRLGGAWFRPPSPFATSLDFKKVEARGVEPLL